ncbi:uncharacterized protein LOC129023534 [Pongo pygmaeus]|uniref:uncharacterized protein LOC129023534 n=1 Tax=Pongo pygmaeus TaxID=9600 RepID=UPI0023E19BA7|nr:uncharacterized protein LOC129023534 [Pongo pygmaeus]
MGSSQKGIACAGSSEKSWPRLHAPEQPHPGSTGYPPCRQAGVTAVPVAKQGQLSSPHPTPSSPAHLYGNGPGRPGLQPRDNLTASVAPPGSVRMCDTPSPAPPPYASPRQRAARGSRFRPGTNSRSARVQRAWPATVLRASNDHGFQPASVRSTTMAPNRPPVSNCFSNREAAMTQLTTPSFTGDPRSSTIYGTGATSGSNHPLYRAAAK